MREILFRGKRYDDGSWVEGYLIHDEFYNTHIPYIGYLCDAGHDVDIAEIILGTVGQFTGLTDKNGKKIFEGDICRIGNLIYKVEFKHSCWWFTILSDKVYCCPAFNSHCGDSCEVIGNIHDNPELLGVTENA